MKSANRLIVFSFMARPPLQIIAARPFNHDARAARVRPNGCIRRAPNKPRQAIQKNKASNTAQNVPDHTKAPMLARMRAVAGQTGAASMRPPVAPCAGINASGMRAPLPPAPLHAPHLAQVDFRPVICSNSSDAGQIIAPSICAPTDNSARDTGKAPAGVTKKPRNPASRAARKSATLSHDAITICRMRHALRRAPGKALFHICV